jgi:hypothetical protein
MALHRPRISCSAYLDAPPAAYYEEFGLTPTSDGRFATSTKGEQLHSSPRAADASPVELRRWRRRPRRPGARCDRAAPARRRGGADHTRHRRRPRPRVRVVLQVTPRVSSRLERAGQRPAIDRGNARADAILRDAPCTAQLRHAVFGTTDLQATRRFTIDSSASD